ncbi:diguanylate cyclase [Oligoflexaceae bacterium]|nr:diguanylate cyclase [Oligoflexaceae bacterium]
MSDDKTIITDGAGMTFFQQPRKKRACFVQYNGPSIGKRHIVEAAEFSIGRNPDNGICLPEGSVSRYHAKCITNGDMVMVEDSGSVNGTFINDQKISERLALRDGDILRLGSVLLKFFAHDNIENVFHDKIYRMATIDAGTQIFNKKYFIEAIESEFKFSKAYDRIFSLIIYDLDHFKKMNDEHGHNAGDFILKESCQLAKACIRKDDILARFGGEEFCIILPNTDAPTAYELAERIRKTIDSHTFHYDNKNLKQSISMGVSQMDKKFATHGELLEDADRKLYASKHGGRNMVTV